MHDGEATVSLGPRQARILRTGEVVRIPANITHAWVNTGAGRFRAVAVHATPDILTGPARLVARAPHGRSTGTPPTAFHREVIGSELRDDVGGRGAARWSAQSRKTRRVRRPSCSRRRRVAGPRAARSTAATPACSQHIGKGITEDWRARWVSLLLESAREAGLPNDSEFRSAFQAYIEWGSRLAVENSQTSSKPPEHMPMPRWDWSTGAGPPGSRDPALGSPVGEPEEPIVLPAADEPVRLEKHIKQLFRARDRNSMTFAFDFWIYEDVRANAAAILERVRAGILPCDGAWPIEQVDVFDRWISNGMAA